MPTKSIPLSRIPPWFGGWCVYWPRLKLVAATSCRQAHKVVVSWYK